jgi:leucyl/phenylalanyl-tRNA--protein transferase
MVFRLTSNLSFPDPALAETDGLLAVGGDLTPARLLLAYSMGIFPWPVDKQPLLWFSPPERCVIFPDKLHVSSSMRKVLRKNKFRFTSNTAFEQVIAACAGIRRKKQRGTWITRDMQQAYTELHRLGHAISVEVWMEDVLVGGFYGVKSGTVFCGESMFSKEPNASKAALIHFIQTSGVSLFDCQVYSEHLKSLGAETISRAAFAEYLA